MSENKKVVGLKALRGAKTSKPEHRCSNCKCARYVPCTCMRKGDERQ